MPCQLSGHFGETPATPKPTIPLFICNHQTSPDHQPGLSRSPCLFLPALPALKMPPEPPARHVLVPLVLFCHAVPSAISPILGTARLEREAKWAGREEETAWAAQHQLPGHHLIP